jgi:coenzyme F420-dependent glucose-6-phosphate dehydrogenase
MPPIGYTLSCEEHPPDDLIRFAARAEESGFDYLFVSDHFHPWIPRQGNSAFVWTLLGGIARETSTISVGTGVTCPTVRIHPAIVAHAAATAATMMPGRFYLGLGSGENLNEHILGDPWPSVARRHEMLAEAIEVIRRLWSGKMVTHHGRHYTVDNAKLYTRPEEPPPIYLAGHGEKAVRLAGELADGFIGVVAAPEHPTLFERTGGAGKPSMGLVKVCFGEDESDARRTAHEWWPTIALRGQLSQDLALPRHYVSATRPVTDDLVAQRIVCGPDPQRHVDHIRSYLDAGYDRVTVHQVGPHQDGFFEFYAGEVLPRLQG